MKYLGKQNPHFGEATSSPQTQLGFQGKTLCGGLYSTNLTGIAC